MKLESGVLITKGFCYVAIGFFAPLGAALAQWADTGTWPPPINWIVILGVCLTGAATQLLGFLSGSYREYMAQRNGNTQFINKPSA